MGTEEMPIAREYIGAVVGESGSVVRQLESDTNCQIRIQKDGNSGIVAIRGIPEAIAEAKSKISDIVAEQDAASRARQQEIKIAREAEEAAQLAAAAASADSKRPSGEQAESSEGTAQEPNQGSATSNSRYIPGMPREWNMQAEEGYSMSSTAQKNRRKRERRKAAIKANSEKEHAKEEHYQQNLQQLLFSNDTSSMVSAPNTFHEPYRPPGTTLEPVPPQHTQMGFPSTLSRPSITTHAPPGFDRPTRSPPPGFENEALMSLADLGFSSSIAQPLQGPTPTSNSAVAKKPAVYVSARGGYKL